MVCHIKIVKKGKRIPCNLRGSYTVLFLRITRNFISSYTLCLLFHWFDDFFFPLKNSHFKMKEFQFHHPIKEEWSRLSQIVSCTSLLEIKSSVRQGLYKSSSLRHCVTEMEEGKPESCQQK